MPSDLPPGTPGWIVLAAFVIVGLKYLGQFLAEMSETWAKILGPLGRRWRERGRRRQIERASENTSRIEDLESDLDYFRKRARAMEAQNIDFLDWYQAHDEPFHRQLRINAAESGCDLPTRLPLSEYRREESA